MKDIIIMDDLCSPANVYIALWENVLLDVVRNIKQKIVLQPGLEIHLLFYVQSIQC